MQTSLREQTKGAVLLFQHNQQVLKSATDTKNPFVFSYYC